MNEQAQTQHPLDAMFKANDATVEGLNALQTAELYYRDQPPVEQRVSALQRLVAQQAATINLMARVLGMHDVQINAVSERVDELTPTLEDYGLEGETAQETIERMAKAHGVEHVLSDGKVVVDPDHETRTIED